jgi:oligoribonuclease (3'-5' exoribonuclease)
MAYRLYRDHAIVSSSCKDEITQQWIPIVSISWTKENGRRDVHFMTNSLALFPNFKEAELYGIERARAWIDLKMTGLD